MAEHRVSMLGTSLRRFEDPAKSSDPRIRTLVAQLATIEPSPPARAHFRAELRAQLVAVAPRLIVEGPAIEAPRSAKAAAAPEPVTKRKSSRLGAAAGWTSRISIARPLAAVTAVIAVFSMLLGGAVWVSKNSLPGDALYSLKRANENVALSLATGDAAKGREYLKLANTRAQEVSDLVSRTASMAGGPGANAVGGVNAHTAALITSTLDSADADTRSGTKLLGAEAVSTGSAEPLTTLTNWAPGQLKRLNSVADRLAAGGLRDRVLASTRLAVAAYSRATALHAALGCNCLDKTATDELGPMPCPSNCSATQHPAQQSPAAPPPSRTKHGATPGVTGSGGGSSATVPLLPSTTVPVPSSPGLTVPLPPVKLPGQPTATPGAASSTQTCTLYLLGICIG